MNVTLFTPTKWQLDVINKFSNSKHKFGIVSTGRQAGKSLMAQNLMLYWLLGKPNMKGAWITPIYNQAKKIFQELTNAGHEIIIHQNKADLTIEFINGSTLIFLSAERSDSIRGFSFHYLVIDEAAFIKEDAIQEAVMPTLTAIGKKCLIISTPKSKNWFYNYWLKGQEENNDYISFKGVSIDNPYVDQSFILEQQKSLPIDIYRQEYEAAFTDAGSDVFTGIDQVCILNEFTQYQKGTRYFVGCDFGISNDYSVLTVVDEVGRVCNITRINGSSYAEVTKAFASVIASYRITGGYAETNGVGLPVYEVLSQRERRLKPFTTTNESKANGIRSLIYDIQEQNITLPSKELFPALYNELNAYTYKISATGTVTFNAPNGMHDDCVMSLMLANEARKKEFTTSKIYVGGRVQNNSMRPTFGTSNF